MNIWEYIQRINILIHFGLHPWSCLPCIFVFLSMHQLSAFPMAPCLMWTKRLQEFMNEYFKKGFREAARHKMVPLSPLQASQSSCREPNSGIS